MYQPKYYCNRMYSTNPIRLILIHAVVSENQYLRWCQKGLAVHLVGFHLALYLFKRIRKLNGFSWNTLSPNICRRRMAVTAVAGRVPQITTGLAGVLIRTMKAVL